MHFVKNIYILIVGGNRGEINITHQCQINPVTVLVLKQKDEEHNTKDLSHKPFQTISRKLLRDVSSEGLKVHFPVNTCTCAEEQCCTLLDRNMHWDLGWV